LLLQDPRHLADDAVSGLDVGGRNAAVDGFATSLGERFGTAVEFFNPFRTVGFDAKKLGVSEEVANTAAVAVGLALRKAGDR